MSTAFGPQPLMPLNTETRHGFGEQYNSEQFLDSLAENFFFYFDDKRHRTNGNPLPEDVKREDKDRYFQPIPDWKIVKDRQKTVSAAILLCLNLGVDPPDVVKTQPCARIEAGVDPLNFQDSKKAIEQMGKRLQIQYETLSLKTRFKQSLDPCVEDVKRFCNSLRRTSKDDRILFHYNGHGVPKPTPSGEIWVFNRGYTQYIPVSIYDLQNWLGAPCIFVYDCNSAGKIITNFKEFVQKRIKDDEDGKHDAAAPSPTSAYLECFQLASCKDDELLLMPPELPADLFTCCLTNPIEISVKVFLMRSLFKSSKFKVLFDFPKQDGSNPNTSDQFFSNLSNFKVPGNLSDRRTPIGELNWVFTAITDTIAWTSLPRPLFKKLFRHDLMVAALFRNFLLAKRIMSWYNCHAMSDPPLPDSISDHPIWKSWDLALDEVLSKLAENIASDPLLVESAAPLQRVDSTQNSQTSSFQQQSQVDTKLGSIQTNSRFAVGNLSNMSLSNHPALQNKLSSGTVAQTSGQHGQQQFTEFFKQNLTAFELWLKYASNTRTPPQQLPIVLQVLLSQVHRIRALVLLSRFLDLGPWAVYLSLSIGIFPYVLKLLQSPAPELKPILVFIWARIMALEYKNIQCDFLKEKGYIYFVNILVPSWNQFPAASPNVNNASYLAMTPTQSFNPATNKTKMPLPSDFPGSNIPYDSNGTTDEQKAMAVFVLSAFIRDFPLGQRHCFSLTLVSALARYMEYSEVPLLRQWSINLLGQFFHKNPLHKHICMNTGIVGVLVKSLNDPLPEVRTATVLSLTQFISDPDDVDILIRLQQEYDIQYQQLHTQLQQLLNSTHQQYQDFDQQQSKLELQLRYCQETQSQLQNVDLSNLRQQELENLLAILPLTNDGSPLVRKEIIVFLSTFIDKYINFFMIVAFDILIEEIMQLDGSERKERKNVDKLSFTHGSIFSSVWKVLLIMASDSNAENREMACSIVDKIFTGIGDHKNLSEPFFKLKEQLLKKNTNIFKNDVMSFDASRVKVIGKSNRLASEKQNNDENKISNPETANHYFLSKFFDKMGLFGETVTSSYSGSSPNRQENEIPYKKMNSKPLPKAKRLYHMDKKVSNGVLKSTFLDFCYEYFQEPQMRNQESDEPGSIGYNERVWKRNRNEKIIEESQSQKKLAIYGDWSKRLTTVDNKSQPKLLQFAQFEKYLISADERDCVRVFDWGNNETLSKFSNENPFGTKITNLKLLNEDDSVLLLTGSSDGVVKVFKDIHDTSNLQMISSWRGLSDLLLTPRSSGLLTDWQQIRGTLLATGDVKFIRLWDAHSESIELDIPAKTSSLVTSITSDQLAGDVFVCGFVDGSLRVYDRRLDPRDAMVRLWRSAGSGQRYSIVNVHMQRGGYRELASGSSNGVVELWDTRSQDSVQRFNVGEPSRNLNSGVMSSSSTMTCMQLHEHAPVIATGTKQIRMWTTSGDLLANFNNTHYGSSVATNIRSSLTANTSGSNSFLSSLAIHPHRMLLAAANSHDSRISVYQCQEKRLDLF